MSSFANNNKNTVKYKEVNLTKNQTQNINNFQPQSKKIYCMFSSKKIKNNNCNINTANNNISNNNFTNYYSNKGSNKNILPIKQIKNKNITFKCSSPLLSQKNSPPISSRNKLEISKKFNYKIKLFKSSQEYSSNSNSTNSRILTAYKKNYPVANNIKLNIGSRNLSLKDDHLQTEIQVNNNQLTSFVKHPIGLNMVNSFTTDSIFKNIAPKTNSHLNQVNYIKTEGNNTSYEQNRNEFKFQKNSNLSGMITSPFIKKTHENCPVNMKENINIFRSSYSKEKIKYFFPNSRGGEKKSIKLANQEDPNLKESITYPSSTDSKIKKGKISMDSGVSILGKNKIRNPEELHFLYVTVTQSGKTIEECFDDIENE